MVSQADRRHAGSIFSAVAGGARLRLRPAKDRCSFKKEIESYRQRLDSEITICELNTGSGNLEPELCQKDDEGICKSDKLEPEADRAKQPETSALQKEVRRLRLDLDVKDREIRAFRQNSDPRFDVNGVSSENESEMENLRTQVKTLTRQLVAGSVPLQGAERELRRKEAEISALRADIVVMKQQLVDNSNDKDREVSALKSEIDALRRQPGAKTSKTGPGEATQRELRRKEAEILALRNNNSELKQQLTDNSKSKEQEISALKSEIHALRQELGARSPPVHAEKRLCQRKNEKPVLQADVAPAKQHMCDVHLVSPLGHAAPTASEQAGVDLVWKFDASDDLRFPLWSSETSLAKVARVRVRLAAGNAGPVADGDPPARRSSAVESAEKKRAAEEKCSVEVWAEGDGESGPCELAYCRGMVRPRQWSVRILWVGRSSSREAHPDVRGVRGLLTPPEENHGPNSSPTQHTVAEAMIGLVASVSRRLGAIDVELQALDNGTGKLVRYYKRLGFEKRPKTEGAMPWMEAPIQSVALFAPTSWVRNLPPACGEFDVAQWFKGMQEQHSVGHSSSGRDRFKTPRDRHPQQAKAEAVLPWRRVRGA